MLTEQLRVLADAGLCPAHQRRGCRHGHGAQSANHLSGGLGILAAEVALPQMRLQLRLVSIAQAVFTSKSGASEGDPLLCLLMDIAGHAWAPFNSGISRFSPR